MTDPGFHATCSKAHCNYVLFSMPPGKILGMSTSVDGQLLCTTADDKALKIFDVVNFGMSITRDVVRI